MLIFREAGRLGNQLFQYAALRTLASPKETLVLLGFKDLQEVYYGINAKIVNSNSPKIERIFYYRLFEFLIRSKFSCSFRESFDVDYPAITYSHRYLRPITVVENSYFQNESQFTNAAIDSLKQREEHLNHAETILDTYDKSKVPIFVHVRRGDYLKWPSKEGPAILSADYYRKCMKIVQSRLLNPLFIFVSDDPFYAKDLFGDWENVYVSEGSPAEDFVLMTKCKGGILSASSFSWWAAYFSFGQNDSTIFLAPEYWIGHRSATWHPKFIKSSFLEYVSS